ncbi:hypothetical protein BCR36DRAFT_416346 [Piromyces finnis]|uniref:Guanylate cyclase domain-containing protein n=1 Tax=Piromyces finnis TaxID=1754191 RepID=A0A1Y1UVS6_9FUNG|nr:hypothetical protein BCR36DRAFT_416346 [Piromyces finnis]|eukprot:ORX42041.1 hypothetical protein BCR36DRAFT_416346 [Piromyces finnis]
MNGYLDMLIDVITSYGGDLSKFSGDAVIFCWTYDLGNDIVENTDYAINFFDTGYMIINVIMCCLELIKTVNENPIYIPGYQTVLGLHMALGAGNMFHIHVGGPPGRWEHFIAGNVTTQLSKLLDEAKSGQIAISNQAWKYIKGFTDEFKKHLTINNNGDGCVIIESGKIPDNIFNIDKKNLRSNSGAKEACFDKDLYNKWRYYVNVSALHKMESGISNLIEFNELRKVTTVFIRLTQIKFNSKDDLQIAQEALSAVQRILAVQEGTLRQFLYDDKGAVILLYFGIPPYSHNNDALNGIESALQICSNLKRILDDFTIGVGTGMTWVGGIGNRIRSDYSVVGDSVNMAARLMMKAKKGKIYCDETTYSLSRDSVQYEDIGLVEVKGKANSIKVYQPIKMKSRITDERIPGNSEDIIELIGREKEISIIKRELIEYDRNGNNKTIIVEGDEGLGLIPLEDKLIYESKKLKFNICFGFSRKKDKATPYSTYYQVILGLFRLIKKISSIKPIMENLKSDNYQSTTDDIQVYTFESARMSDELINSKYKSLRIEDTMYYSGSLSSTNSNQSNLVPSNSDIINTPVSMLNNQTINQLLYKHELYSENDGEMVMTKSKSFDNKSSGSNIDIKELRSNSRSDQSYSENNGLLGLEKDIIDGLLYLGENIELAPLLSIAIPETNFPIGESLKKINNQTKINELNNLIIRILIKVSYRVPLVIIIDHLQWSDPLSWKLTELIFQQKPKLLFCLFSFPDSSYSSKEKGVQIFQKMKNSNSRKIILNGVSEDATCEIIKRLCTAKFNTPCNGVSTKILNIIYQKTQGIPMFVRRMVTWMLDEGKACKLDNLGYLTVLTDDLEEIIPGGDLESIIITQFDRLQNNMQSFLRVASVIGQQFYVFDIMQYLYSVYKKNLNQLQEIKYLDIDKLDKYNFLKKVDSPNESSWLFDCYMFISSNVQKSIYKMMTFDQRTKIHSFLAHYYEQQYLDCPDKKNLLVIVYEHFSHTNKRKKTRKYLELVCKYFYQIRSMHETIKYYKLLFKMFNDEESTLIIEVGNRTLSQWHRELGDAYLQIMMYKEAEKHISIALELMKISLPKSNITIKIKEKIYNSKHKLLIKNDFKNEIDNKNKERNEAIRNCLLGLSEIYNEQHITKYFLMTVKLGILYSVKLYPDPQFAQMLTMYGLNLLIQAKNDMQYDLSWVYLLKAEEVIFNQNENTINHLITYDNLGLANFIVGKWNIAARKFDSLVKLGYDLNERSYIYKGLTLRSFMEFHRGNFKASSKFAQELYYKGIERNNWKNKCLSTSLIYLNYLTIDDEDDMSLILNIIKLIDQLGDKPETVNYTIQLLFYSLIADIKFRLHIDILSNFWFSMKKCINILNKLNRSSWVILLCFSHFIEMLYHCYEENIFHNGGEQSKICINILNSIIDILENHFQSYLLSIPFLALCHGLKNLILGKMLDAIKSWKKGIIVGGTERNLTGMPYLNSLIYSKLVQYSSDSIDTEKYKNLFIQIKQKHNISIEYPEPLTPEQIKKPVMLKNNNANNENLISKFIKFRTIIGNMDNKNDLSTAQIASIDTRGSSTYQIEEIIHHGLSNNNKASLIENSVNKGIPNKPSQILTNQSTQVSIAQQKSFYTPKYRTSYILK